MRIIKIELINYRGFKSKTIKFDPQFNVIMGINGIGKTSTLDALATLFSRILPRITPYCDYRMRFSRNDISIESDFITARASLLFEKFSLDYSIVDEVKGKRPKSEILQSDSKKSIYIKEFDKNSLSSTKPTPIAVYYTTDRAGFRVTRKYQVPAGRAAAYQGALRDKLINYRRFVSWLGTRRRLAEESTTDRKIFEVVETALRTFLPNFDSISGQDDPPKLFINKNGKRLSAEQLSDGERNYVALVVDIARHLALANPVDDNPLINGKGVVMIDELEIHLHPKWQREVVESLHRTFPQIQFITTTHSPFIIQSLKPGQLIDLDPDSGQDEFADRSIEDITEFIMKIPMPQKSQRYKAMIDTAEEYYQILKQYPDVDTNEKIKLREKLDEMLLPYSDDAAFVAFLKFQRGVNLKEDATS
jgi:predicted ATP-binding protein involved in virulence